MLLVSWLQFAAGAQAPAEQTDLIATYCTECHNSEDWAGSLDLELPDLNNAVADAEVWEKVLRKFRGNMMPPQGNQRPSAEEYAALTHWLTHTIDSATLAEGDPGQSSLHRLNRTEYGNAIRDLLHLDVDISEFLPADDEGYGFDNIADVLRTSPALLEQSSPDECRERRGKQVSESRLRHLRDNYCCPFCAANCAARRDSSQCLMASTSSSLSHSPRFGIPRAV